MTGAEINDGLVGLAARIILRAQDDCKGKIEGSAGSDMVKALIQHDAVRWLESSPWCDALLYCLPAGYRDIPQEEVARRAIRKRKKSYLKYLPKNLDAGSQVPLIYLSKLTGIDKDKMYYAARKGTFHATKEEDGHWYSTLTELAVALVAGDLKIEAQRDDPFSEPSLC